MNNGTTEAPQLRERATLRPPSSLVHLDGEGRVAAGEVIAGADVGENAVDEADAADLAGTQQPIWATSDLADANLVAAEL